MVHLHDEPSALCFLHFIRTRYILHNVIDWQTAHADAGSVWELTPTVLCWEYTRVCDHLPRYCRKDLQEIQLFEAFEGYSLYPA